MNERYEPGNIVFGSWSIVKKIGEGSFGKIYEIEKEDFGNVYKAALKVITLPQNQAEVNSFFDAGMNREKIENYYMGVIEELITEFTIMSKLKGESNIVSYEDHIVKEHLSDIGWDILIKMELLTPLTSYINTADFYSKDVIKLGIDICTALELCHKKNIVHRDIKMENIFVSEAGNYKLGDFGIAKISEKFETDLTLKGTSHYMAPEIYNHCEYNSTVDIYSLGLVLYKLLNNNRLPFLSTDTTVTPTLEEQEHALSLRMSGKDIEPPLYASSELSNIILTACSYDYNKRYSTPTEMKEALLKIYNSEENTIVLEQHSLNNDISLEEEKTENILNESAASFKDREKIIHSTNNFSNSYSSHKRQKKLGTLMCFFMVGILLVVALLLISQRTKSNEPKKSVDTSGYKIINKSNIDISKLSPETINKIITGEIDISKLPTELIDKINSGEIDISKLPTELIDKIVSGEIDITKLPPELIDMINSDEIDIAKLSPELIDMINSSNIDISKLPSELINKIISGEIDIAKLPPELINKINSGEIDASKISSKMIDQIVSSKIDISKLPPKLINQVISGEIDISKLPPELISKINSGEIDVSKISPKIINQIASSKIDISKLPPKLVNKIISGEIDISKLPPKLINKINSGEIDLSKLPPELIDKIASGEIDISKLSPELIDKIVSSEIDISKLPPELINKINTSEVDIYKLPLELLNIIASNNINISKVSPQLIDQINSDVINEINKQGLTFSQIPIKNIEELLSGELNVSNFIKMLTKLQ